MAKESCFNRAHLLFIPAATFRQPGIVFWYSVSCLRLRGVCVNVLASHLANQSRLDMPVEAQSRKYRIVHVSKSQMARPTSGWRPVCVGGIVIELFLPHLSLSKAWPDSRLSGE